MAVSFGKDYETKFNIESFLEYYKNGNSESVSAMADFFLKELHSFYNTFIKEENRKWNILDLGCGPIIVYQISATKIASEIVLAEYTSNNRQAVQQWLNKNPSCIDWTFAFNFVVKELEGGSEADVEKRQDELRQVIKSVIPCDVTKKEMIPDEHKGPYDVVFSSLVLESACRTVEDYNATVARIVKIYVKSGGRIVMHCAITEKPSSLDEQCFYKVGEERFFDLGLNEGIVRTALESAGCCDIITRMIDKKTTGIPDDAESPSFKGFIFVSAKKTFK